VNAVVRTLLEALRDGTATPKTRHLARRLLEREDEREARAAARACSTSKVAKAAIASVEHHQEARRAEERESEKTSAAVWKACVERSVVDHRGVRACELCDRSPLSVGNLEPHHLEYGSGNRLEKEKVENVMAVCRKCHDAFHARPSKYVAKVVAWCRAHLYPLPNRKEYRT
jgi:5-methylcytosine-specific restriction endonuclease McrA